VRLYERCSLGYHKTVQTEDTVKMNLEPMCKIRHGENGHDNEGCSESQKGQRNGEWSKTDDLDQDVQIRHRDETVDNEGCF